ncbi:MAG TPA: hypothetical protein VG406_06120 [Isosphaeraceae bacterium]|jgi:signal transduction histidine kinase|nr:hypothetical protein [Isosphaeraceae bacterium]
MARESDPEEGLSCALWRVATDPAKVQALYEMLGEYCHELRNRLNGIKISLFLARRQACPLSSPAWAEAELRYRAVEELVDRLQMICRPLDVFAITLDLSGLIAERLPYWCRDLDARGRRLVPEAPPAPALGRFDPARLAQGLDALVAWRARAGDPDTTIRLRWGADQDHLSLEWHEPEGTDPLDATDDLALPILARIIAAHGGRCQLTAEPGLRLRCRWPS